MIQNIYSEIEKQSLKINQDINNIKENILKEFKDGFHSQFKISYNQRGTIKEEEKEKQRI